MPAGHAASEFGTVPEVVVTNEGAYTTGTGISVPPLKGSRELDVAANRMVNASGAAPERRVARHRRAESPEEVDLVRVGGLEKGVLAPARPAPHEQIRGAGTDGPEARLVAIHADGGRLTALLASRTVLRLLVQQVQKGQPCHEPSP
jgi:hypothetical protein